MVFEVFCNFTIKCCFRAFSSGVPNAKYLAFGTPKTEHHECAICAKIMRHATVRSHFLKRMDENAIYVYYYFIHLFLSSRLKYKFIFTFSQSFSASPSPLSHALFFSLLLYSLPIHESWATTDFLSIISQILPSLIYEIRFTDFFPNFFPFFFSLSFLFYDLIHWIGLVHLRVVDSRFNLSHHRFPLYHLTNSTITDL